MTELTRRQAEILEIAEHIIVSDGIFTLTIRNIANAAGISEPAVYRHFKSKNDILLGILRQFEKTTLELFGRLKQGMPAIDALEEIYTDRLKELSHDSASTAIIFAGDYLRSEPAVAEKLNSLIEDHRKRLETIVKHGQNTGELRDDIPADHMCAVIMGTIRMAVRKCYRAGRQDTIETKGIDLFKSIKAMVVKAEK